MVLWDDTFHEFLTKIDEQYADYFSGRKRNERSVTFYFGTLNGGNLKIVLPGLRIDIYKSGSSAPSYLGQMAPVGFPLLSCYLDNFLSC
jgi:hypothetical protein